MLHRGTDPLTQATAARTVVPALATYNRKMMQAVVAAAEQTGPPVIMLAGSSHFYHPNRAAETGVVALAVAVGNVPGLTSRPVTAAAVGRRATERRSRGWTARHAGPLHRGLHRPGPRQVISCTSTPPAH
jgi:fructose/tagatose bisphosphate aldolase